jgi:hypothetical protein
MDNFILGMIAGIFIGAFIGVLILSCLVAGRNDK